MTEKTSDSITKANSLIGTAAAYRERGEQSYATSVALAAIAAGLVAVATAIAESQKPAAEKEPK